MFADAMGGQISDHVIQQMRQLYSKRLTRPTSGYINVEVVPVHRQPNGHPLAASTLLRLPSNGPVDQPAWIANIAVLP